MLRQSFLWLLFLPLILLSLHWFLFKGLAHDYWGWDFRKAFHSCHQETHYWKVKLISFLILESLQSSYTTSVGSSKNCIDKTLSEKKRQKTYLKRWGKGDRRRCKQHWNSSQCIHQSKEAKSHGTHKRKRNILEPAQPSKQSLWKPREKVLKATGLRECQLPSIEKLRIWQCSPIFFNHSRIELILCLKRFIESVYY